MINLSSRAGGWGLPKAPKWGQFGAGQFPPSESLSETPVFLYGPA